MEASKGGALAPIILLGLLLQSPQATLQPDTWPVKGVNRSAATHLIKEINKADNPDDPGKMILLWSKISSGTISESEVAILRTIANRQTGRQFGPDTDLYMTLFAGQLLNLYENRQEEQRRRNEQTIANDRVILELQKQINDLKQQLVDQRKELDDLKSQNKKLQ